MKMKQHTITGHLVWEIWKDSTEGRFVLQSSRARTSEYYTQVPVCERAITFDVPDDFDPRGAQVDALKAEQNRIRGEMSARITQLQEQINKLTAIEFTGSGE